AVVPPLRAVLRLATEEDQRIARKNREKEEQAFELCQKKIEARGLDMKLVDVEYSFDGSKILFFFTSDGRVDFRELVKDLAGVFRTRIELRQIGVRDEARMVGGIGSCGRPLCCASWLGDFEPVSIRMAKNQNLSLNPTKISGSCGRLMCCLKYEDYMYAKEKGKGSRPRKEYAEAPQVGSMVATSMGKGKVTTVNKAKHTATVQLSPDNVVTLEWDELIDASQAMDDD
ncbi:MAG: stage 0 sporulation family protein, partial [Acidaminococcaceae bacterium]|nr:stage 0 sporulation family protein [Acidaminococcaceae bacterium]